MNFVAGKSYPYTVIATGSDGSTIDRTASVTATTGNDHIAQFVTPGQIKLVGGGTVTVTFTDPLYGPVTQTLVVQPPVTYTLAVTFGAAL